MQTGMNNIEMHNEMFSMDNPGVFHTGDVMFDNTLFFAELADEKIPLKDFEINQLNYPEGKPVKMCHLKRVSIYCNYTQGSKYRKLLPMQSIFKALVILAKHTKTIIMPLHPRTEKVLRNDWEKIFIQKWKNRNLLRWSGSIFL